MAPRVARCVARRGSATFGWGAPAATGPGLFDRTTLLRFGLIVGAGMSTVAGALVERLINALLDWLWAPMESVWAVRPD